MPFREALGKKEEGSAEGGGEVDLLGEFDTRIVFDDPKRFVHSSGEVERAPAEEIGAKGVNGCNAVFNSLYSIYYYYFKNYSKAEVKTHDAIDCHIWVKPHAWSHILHHGHKIRAKHPRCHRIMCRVPRHINGMPMRWMGHCENKV